MNNRNIAELALFSILNNLYKEASNVKIPGVEEFTEEQLQEAVLGMIDFEDAGITLEEIKTWWLSQREKEKNILKDNLIITPNSNRFLSEISEEDQKILGLKVDKEDKNN